MNFFEHIYLIQNLIRTASLGSDLVCFTFLDIPLITSPAPAKRIFSVRIHVTSSAHAPAFSYWTLVVASSSQIPSQIGFGFWITLGQRFSMT